MLTIHDTITPNGETMLFAIEGMRNSFNSWDKSDSFLAESGEAIDILWNVSECNAEDGFHLGDADRQLMRKLVSSGSSHRKFLRMMPVMVRVTAPMYWWKEFDTYKVGTVRNSCSTMHKIQEKEFTRDDFSCEHLGDIGFTYPTVKFEANKHIDSALDLLIGVLNTSRYRYLKTNKKDYWWEMIQLLPSSYNQTANLALNYEVLRTIWHDRRHHKLDEWHTFCDWIERLPYAELITDSWRKEEE